MFKRWRFWLTAMALVAVALAVYFEPTHCVRGWLWGEAFFDGRPTSYWRGVVQRDLHLDPRRFFVSRRMPPASWLERVKEWVGFQPNDFGSFDLVRDDKGAEVLRELADDADEAVSAFAKAGLDPAFSRPVEAPEGHRDDRFHRWVELLGKLHQKAPP
jgi:hypothetical protein